MDMSECEWSQLPKATCAHCTGSRLPTGVGEEPDFRDYATVSERLMEREPWEQEVEESIRHQGYRLLIGGGKGERWRFRPSAFDLWEEGDDDGK